MDADISVTFYRNITSYYLVKSGKGVGGYLMKYITVLICVVNRWCMWYKLSHATPPPPRSYYLIEHSSYECVSSSPADKKNYCE